MLQRARVGDTEGQKIDTVPLEADAGQAEVTLGSRWATERLTQSLEADTGQAGVTLG